MIKTRIDRQGERTVLELTDAMLDLLQVRPGDTVICLPDADGALKILPPDHALSRALEVAEIVMDENSDLLKGLG